MQILVWIKNLFTSKKPIDIEDLPTEQIWKAYIHKVREEPRLWKINGVDLKWFGWENRKIVGWKTSKPMEGDIIQAEMESGHKAWFVIINRKLCGDPDDMFFVEVADLGYRMYAKEHIELAEPKIRLL